MAYVMDRSSLHEDPTGDELNLSSVRTYQELEHENSRLRVLVAELLMKNQVFRACGQGRPV